MFEELNKLYKVEWDKDKILLIDLELTINPPYKSKDVIGSPKKSVMVI